MKSNLLNFLACPTCRQELNLITFERDSEIKSGALICSACKVVYPVYDYVPRLFVYSLPEYSEFRKRWKKELDKIGFKFSLGLPERGEQFTQKSFSTEWLEKEYDDYLWSYDVERLRAFVLAQLGYSEKKFAGKALVDVGCGNGVISNLFSQFGSNVVGLDINFAIVRAAKHFKQNKKLHFVQGSAFHPPFKKGIFDIVYSTGVLHHTYNTKKAFFSMSDLCKNGGRIYIWLYGDYRGFIKAFNIATNSIRLVVSRLPSRIQNFVIKTMAVFYGIAHGHMRKFFMESKTINYNRNQLIHAVRDRFTPVYAHMHSSSEVTKWFADAGFSNIAIVPKQGTSVRGDRI